MQSFELYMNQKAFPYQLIVPFLIALTLLWILFQAAKEYYQAFKQHREFDIVSFLNSY